MAYFIFLKYLRSLEVFRKNPHVKIPPKSRCTNFQSLGIFKNQILFRKEFSSLSAQPPQPAHPEFRPSHDPLLLSFPTGPLPPPPPHWASASRPSQPACALVAPHPVATLFTGKHLQPCRLRPSPHPADRWAPPITPHLRLRPSSAVPPPPPAAPAAPPSSAPQDAARAITAPPSLPVNPPPLLTLPPPSMVLKPLMPPLPSHPSSTLPPGHSPPPRPL
jgi:hypothetical protein